MSDRKENAPSNVNLQAEHKLVLEITNLCQRSSLSAKCFQTQAARHRSVAFKCDKTDTATSGGKLLRSGKDFS